MRISQQGQRRDEAVAGVLRLELWPGAPPKVPADRTRLQQALANLVDNGLAYTPSGGSVHIEVLATENEAGLRVVDTGPGIPRDEQARIFERLYRGDASRSERGAGLGLSMVDAIAKAHGGRVELASEGEGSTFTLWLPKDPSD